MKIKLTAILNAPDDFRCGECNKCPIHTESYFSTHQYTETKVNCPLGYTSVSCPIEICESVNEVK